MVMSLAPAADTVKATVLQPRRSFFRRIDLIGYAFISPWLIGFVVFTAGPFLASLFISLTDWGLVGSWKFVGLANYQRMLTGRDDIFLQALRVTFIYCIIRVPLSQIIALALATLLNQKIKARPFFRTIFYLPAVTEGAAMAYLWFTVFSSQVGFVNHFLAAFGIEGPNWLYSVEWSLYTLIIISLWNVGTTMLIYLAALQGVPESLHEAAMMDGAGIWARFRHVTIPMITPAIFFNTVLGFIGSFQVFTAAFIITNGGPGYATTFYILYLYRTAFLDLKMGYASALAWILFAIILTLTAIQLWLSKRWVYYEGESQQSSAR
jgi:multiple sugar transport system permease protein